MCSTSAMTDRSRSTDSPAREGNRAGPKETTNLSSRALTLLVLMLGANKVFMKVERSWVCISAPRFIAAGGASGLFGLLLLYVGFVDARDDGVGGESAGSSRSQGHSVALLTHRAHSGLGKVTLFGGEEGGVGTQGSGSMPQA
ncbi:hypothetical protein AbraIFM66951_006710 [Aspergillus brasiliensis]|uniref:Uncharacterized protein n=1 Tax=Aspergillus brasiliensis TaxID=319629 RepID=A0A9W6DM12_9EURO|nr:hypothetical protein AbraCBS73388_007424 [Aspergillus brasiliensis]GKZ44506.1 hypothetical protein AbraIFM66951_006710 [Aspergillus brasiliensis]